MHQTEQSEQVKKLAGLMKDVRIAMLTTVTPDGSLHSRPMGVQQVEFDGDLWFFTQRSSRKSDEIRHDQQVNVAFADTKAQSYVSVSGRAALVDDRAKMKELWNPIYKAWFPKGLEDPELTLLRVDVDGAEYWESPSSTVVQIVGFVKAVVTGKEADIGENERVSLR